MDNLVYEESINSEVTSSEFVSKKWIYANDNNSQNYSSQVIIDTTALSNSGAYLMWSEAFIIMPLVVCLSVYNATLAGAGKYVLLNSEYIDKSWCFKSGFMNMIHSATIEYNNSNVCQQTPLMNVFKNFEILTSWSLDNLKNDSFTTGYYPDSSETFGIVNAGNQQYCGVAVGTNPQLFNNCVGVFSDVSFPQTNTTTKSAGSWAGLTISAGGGAGADSITFTGTSTANLTVPSVPLISDEATALQSSYINEGAYRRNLTTCTDVSFAGFQKTLGQDAIFSDITLKTNWANQRTTVSSQTIGYGQADWLVYGKLYLKNFADIFSKAPLLKGSTLRFYINTNQCISEFTTTVGTGAQNYTNGSIVSNSIAITNNGGSTNPLMITNLFPYALGNCQSANDPAGTGAIAIADGSSWACKLSVSIYQNRWSQQSNLTNWSSSPLQSCRLYAPAYKFTSLAEQKYLSLSPTKTIEYNDIFQYQFQNLSGASDFNILVSNGLQGIQNVLVIPFIQNDSNSSLQKTSYTTLLSPLTTSGSTPDPVPITNFNILVSGVNLFLDNQQYNFQSFLQELKSSNQLNGNLTNGLTSGLINENDFSGLYRYYYGNCKRVLPAEEDVSRSVQIRGRLNLKSDSDKVMLMVFIQFKRKITIDLQTGARID